MVNIQHCFVTILLVNASLLILASQAEAVGSKEKLRHQEDEGDDESLSQLETRSQRRQDLRQALALLKKHSVIGDQAKFVLLMNGKHLLVDKSGQLQVVNGHPDLAEDDEDEPTTTTTTTTTPKPRKSVKTSGKNQRNSKQVPNERQRKSKSKRKGKH